MSENNTNDGAAASHPSEVDNSPTNGHTSAGPALAEEEMVTKESSEHRPDANGARLGESTRSVNIPNYGKHSKAGWFYVVFLVVLRFVSRIFFRKIEVTGQETIPKENAVIFAGNHPNALVDPVLIMLNANRPVKTMGKSSIFTGPIGYFFRGLGGIPVYRRMDVKPGEKTPANQDSFREVHKVLEEGGAFSIFPEGTSHTKSILLELKFGLAHMALKFLAQAKEKHGVAPNLKIVPVGLSYMNKQHRFRGECWIKFGQGFEVPEEIVDMYSTGDKDIVRKAVRDLTSIVGSAIRRYTITAPDWDTVELILLSATIFRRSPKKAHASRPCMCWCCKVSDNYQMPLGNMLHMSSVFRQGAVMMRDDPIALHLRAKLTEYSSILETLNMTDSDIRIHRDLGVIEIFLSALFYILVLFIGIPLCLPAFIWNLPIMVPTWLLSIWIAGTERDVVSTFKCIVAFFLVPLVYGTYIGVLSWLCAYKFDRLMEATDNLHVIVYIIIFAILFPIMGVCALLLFEGVMDARRHCFRMARLLSYRFSIERAKELRQECHEVLHGIFAIVSTRQIREEAATVYSDTKLLSRAEGIARVREFAEREGITEHSALLPAEDDTDGTHQQDELRSIMAEFGRTQRAERENLIENTSLAVADLQSQKAALGRSRGASLTSASADPSHDLGSLGSRTPSRGNFRGTTGGGLADAQIELRNSFLEDDIAGEMAREEVDAEMDQEDAIARQYGVYKPQDAALPNHVRQKEEDEGLCGDDDDDDEIAVPPRRSQQATPSSAQASPHPPSISPKDI